MKVEIVHCPTDRAIKRRSRVSWLSSCCNGDRWRRAKSGAFISLGRKTRPKKISVRAFRTLKPGGLLFAAAISRFASALDGIFRNLIQDPEFFEIVRRDLKLGQHRNPSNHPEYFTTAFFLRPSELQTEIRTDLPP